jgi:hypothetical protein
MLGEWRFKFNKYQLKQHTRKLTASVGAHTNTHPFATFFISVYNAEPQSRVELKLLLRQSRVPPHIYCPSYVLIPINFGGRTERNLRFWRKTVQILCQENTRPPQNLLAR